MFEGASLVGWLFVFWTLLLLGWHCVRHGAPRSRTYSTHERTGSR